MTNPMQTSRVVSRETLVDAVTNFAATDAKGRVLGAWVKIERVEMAANEDLNAYGWVCEPGIWFEVTAQTTKNGRRWGASQGRSSFRDLAEAQARAGKRVADIRKKAER